MVQAQAVERIYHYGNKPLAGSPVGQIVGRMNALVPAGEIVKDIADEADAVFAKMLR